LREFGALCIKLHEQHTRDPRRPIFVHPSSISVAANNALRWSLERNAAPHSQRDRATLAPELHTDDATFGPRATVFAIGAMLYESCTGRTIGPQRQPATQCNPALPEALETLLAQALITEPARRPDDLLALAAALRQLSFTTGMLADLHTLAPATSAASSPSSHGPDAAHQNEAHVTASATAADDLRERKARLEADPQPRFTVHKNRMDHGPFSAVELLQQIANHTFFGEHLLRDNLTGMSQRIDAWEDFAPFALHAAMHRTLEHEQRTVEQLARTEKKTGLAKTIAAIIIGAAVLASGITFIVKKKGHRATDDNFFDDPRALDLSSGGALQGDRNGRANRKKLRGADSESTAPTPPSGPRGISFEAAQAGYRQEINMGSTTAPVDLTESQLSAPLQRVSFVSDCGAPAGMRITVRAAVQNGRAAGVTVSSSPPDDAVTACIDRRVRDLTWPSSPQMDFITTTY